MATLATLGSFHFMATFVIVALKSGSVNFANHDTTLFYRYTGVCRDTRLGCMHGYVMR